MKGTTASGIHVNALPSTESSENAKRVGSLRSLFGEKKGPHFLETPRLVDLLMPSAATVEEFAFLHASKANH